MTRQLKLQFLAIPATVLASAVAAFFSTSFEDSKPVMPQLAAIACFASIVVIAVIAGCLLYDEIQILVVKQKQQLNEIDQQLRKLRSFDSVPQNILFKNRKDIITIVDEDTVKYNFSISIETKEHETCTSLVLPFEFELGFPKDKYAESVKMVKLKVNNATKPIDKTICFRQLRDSIATNPSQVGCSTFINGVLSIPVPLGIGCTTCSVEIEFLVYKAFAKMKDREFIYIDIPYVTESMFVKIEGSKNLKVRGVPNSVHVEATSYFLQHTDHGETENEKSNLSKWEDGIEWETTYPKLGYRYLVYFQVH